MRFVEGWIGLAAAAFGVIANASTTAQVTLGVLAVLCVVSAVIDDRRP